MRRQFLLASAGALAIMGSAFAAEPLPLPPPPEPIFTWTGLYAGAQVGYAWDRDRVTATSFSDIEAGEPPDIFFAQLSDSPSGVIGGIHVGYNKQINQWVLGLEGSVDGTSVHNTLFSQIGIFSADPDAFNSPIFATLHTFSAVQGSIRLRAGIAFDRVLLYATGGAAFAGVTTDYTSTVPFFLTESDSKTRSGWTVGGGLEYAVTNNWSIRAEYRYSDFGHTIDYPFAAIADPFGIQSVQHHLTQNQVQFGISYKFDTMAPVVAKY